jgi:hypothetical protein
MQKVLYGPTDFSEQHPGVQNSKIFWRRSNGTPEIHSSLVNVILLD